MSKETSNRKPPDGGLTSATRGSTATSQPSADVMLTSARSDSSCAAGKALLLVPSSAESSIRRFPSARRMAGEAIAAGAFHNDVVAVANERVLFTHARAFADQHSAYDAIRAAFPPLEVVEVPEEAVSLEEAIRTYLFNAQLLTLPSGEMALVVPEECRESASVWRW